MLKLMKYELRKQAFSKLVIVIIAAFLEVIFFAGLLLDKNDTIGLAIGLLSMFAMGAMFFIAFESIITYYNDLKQKQSYMLFLTPHSPYAIVGAKVLSAGLQVILSGLAFGLIVAGNGAALLAKYSSINQLKNFLREFLNVQYHINVDGKLLVLGLLTVLITWISTITLAYLSVTLSTTFLANKKGKALISFLIFLALEYVFNRISDLIMGISFLPSDAGNNLIITILLFTVFTAVTYFATAWMLDKKVSV
jgi:ABC-2 type transport system permease protein